MQRMVGLFILLIILTYCSLEIQQLYNSSNQAITSGGAVYTKEQSGILVDEYSSVTLYNNSATYGGGVYSLSHCDISFGEDSVVITTMALMEELCSLQHFQINYYMGTLM